MDHHGLSLLNISVGEQIWGRSKGRDRDEMRIVAKRLGDEKSKRLLGVDETNR